MQMQWLLVIYKRNMCIVGIEYCRTIFFIRNSFLDTCFKNAISCNLVVLYSPSLMYDGNDWYSVYQSIF